VSIVSRRFAGLDLLTSSGSSRACRTVLARSADGCQLKGSGESQRLLLRLFQLANGFLAEVPSSDLPVVVDLDQHRLHQPQQGVSGGQDADHVRSSFHLLIELFQRIGGVDGGPMLSGEDQYSRLRQERSKERTLATAW